MNCAYFMMEEKKFLSLLLCKESHNKFNQNTTKLIIIVFNHNIKYIIIIKCDLVAYPSIIHFYFLKQRN